MRLRRIGPVAQLDRSAAVSLNRWSAVRLRPGPPCELKHPTGLIFWRRWADGGKVTTPSSALSLGGKSKPAPKPGTRFVARQPILTADEKVFGYELLFRDGIENFFSSTDADDASRSALNTSSVDWPRYAL